MVEKAHTGMRCVRKRIETIWRYLWHPKYAHNSTLRLTKGISPPGVVWKMEGLVSWLGERGLSLINCVYSYAKIRIADWATFCRSNPLNLMEKNSLKTNAESSSSIRGDPSSLAHKTAHLLVFLSVIFQQQFH